MEYAYVNICSVRGMHRVLVKFKRGETDQDSETRGHLNWVLKMSSFPGKGDDGKSNWRKCHVQKQAQRMKGDGGFHGATI